MVSAVGTEGTAVAWSPALPPTLPPTPALAPDETHFPAHRQILRRGKKVSASGLASASRRMADLHAKAGSKEQVAADRAAFKGERRGAVAVVVGPAVQAEWWWKAARQSLA